MKKMHYDEVEAEPVGLAGAGGCEVRWLIGPADEPPGFYMRRFELKPSGKTPHHAHEWEHELYILEGQGTLLCDGEERPFRAGDFIYIEPGEDHQLTAAADDQVALLCMVPKKAGG